VTDDEVPFRRSSYCSSGGCVEVGRLADGGVAVRDAKNPEQPALLFTGQEWSVFVAGVRAGEFD
jgi:hypothetical protein